MSIDVQKLVDTYIKLTTTRSHHLASDSLRDRGWSGCQESYLCFNLYV